MDASSLAFLFRCSCEAKKKGGGGAGDRRSKKERDKESEELYSQSSTPCSFSEAEGAWAEQGTDDAMWLKPR